MGNNAIKAARDPLGVPFSSTTAVVVNLHMLFRPRTCLQEDDVIGTLSADEKIGNMKPIGDRVLIKVREGGATQQRIDGQPQNW